jgi:hypothetical protein
MWELFSHLSVKGQVFLRNKRVEVFCGLIPSLTLRFARGGELFLTFY